MICVLINAGLDLIFVCGCCTCTILKTNLCRFDPLLGGVNFARLTVLIAEGQYKSTYRQLSDVCGTKYALRRLGYDILYLVVVALARSRSYWVRLLRDDAGIIRVSYSDGTFDVI